MDKLSKQILRQSMMHSISVSAAQASAFSDDDVYYLKTKNAFRGGSRGKGGKIKYTRR